jgi:protein-S-isoprenylcysteine O-methyltransferase Ste14
VAFAGSAALAEGWFVLSRLAYVGFVAVSLRAVSRARSPDGLRDADARWQRFAARASHVMFGDAIAFCALCVVTRGTIPAAGPTWLAPALGGIFLVLGVGTKVWATAHLEKGSFYWRDFFVPHEERVHSASGPYRWLANPMYTVGYAHTYGLALLLASGPGLLGAAFAQVMIVLLATLVERPHVRRFRREPDVWLGEQASDPRPEADLVGLVHDLRSTHPGRTDATGARVDDLDASTVGSRERFSDFGDASTR